MTIMELRKYGIKKEYINNNTDKRSYSYTLPNGNIVEAIWSNISEKYNFFYIVDKEAGTMYLSPVRLKQIGWFESELAFVANGKGRWDITDLLDIDC